MNFLESTHVSELRLPTIDHLVIPSYFPPEDAERTIAFFQRHLSLGPLERLTIHQKELEIPSRLALLSELRRTGVLDRMIVVLKEYTGEYPDDAKPIVRSIPTLVTMEVQNPPSSTAALRRLNNALWRRLEEIYDAWSERLVIAPDLGCLEHYRVLFDVPSDLVALVDAYIGTQLTRLSPERAAAEASGAVLRSRVAAMSSTLIILATGSTPSYEQERMEKLVKWGLWDPEEKRLKRWASAMYIPEVVRSLRISPAHYREHLSKLGWKGLRDEQQDLLVRVQDRLAANDLEGADLLLRSLATDEKYLLASDEVDPAFRDWYQALALWFDIAASVGGRPNTGMLEGYPSVHARNAIGAAFAHFVSEGAVTLADELVNRLLAVLRDYQRRSVLGPLYIGAAFMGQIQPAPVAVHWFRWADKLCPHLDAEEALTVAVEAARSAAHQDAVKGRELLQSISSRVAGRPRTTFDVGRLRTLAKVQAELNQSSDRQKTMELAWSRGHRGDRLRLACDEAEWVEHAGLDPWNAARSLATNLSTSGGGIGLRKMAMNRLWRLLLRLPEIRREEITALLLSSWERIQNGRQDLSMFIDEGHRTGALQDSQLAIPFAAEKQP